MLLKLQNEMPLSFQGYLEKQDCNFIAVDWSTMATGNYSYVATNYVPLAGTLTGQFINFLVSHGAMLDDFHLTGHRYVPHGTKKFQASN